MLVDFHTHVFPEKIAAKTIALLEQKVQSYMPGFAAFGDGTLQSLQSSMQQSGTDLSVALPVVTAPRQFESINRYAAQINAGFDFAGKKGVLSFGGIHPQSEDINGQMKTLYEMGFRGIKLHPDYQGTYMDDDRYVQILRCAKQWNMTVVCHAGFDVGFPEEIHCTPQRAVRLLEKLGEKDLPRVVFAHLGGYTLYDDVVKYLAGAPVYFDLSFALVRTPVPDVMRLIALQGEDRMLYATDFPWGGQREFADCFAALPLTPAQREKIGYRNALGLLGL